MKKLLFISLAIALFGCNRESAPDCFKKAGENIVVKIETGRVNSLTLIDDVDIILIQDTVDFGLLQGPKNLIPKIDLNNSGGELTIENNNTCNFMRSFDLKFTLELHCSELQQIINKGVGNLDSKDTLTFPIFSISNHGSSGSIRLTLKCDSLNYANHAGVSDVELRGICNSAVFFHQGTGPFYAEHMNAEQVWLNNSTIANMHVRANSYLSAGIYNDGNIYYSGNPNEIDLLKNGNGDLIYNE